MTSELLAVDSVSTDMLSKDERAKHEKFESSSVHHVERRSSRRGGSCGRQRVRESSSRTGDSSTNARETRRRGPQPSTYLKRLTQSQREHIPPRKDPYKGARAPHRREGPRVPRRAANLRRRLRHRLRTRTSATDRHRAACAREARSALRLRPSPFGLFGCWDMCALGWGRSRCARFTRKSPGVLCAVFFLRTSAHCGLLGGSSVAHALTSHLARLTSLVSPLRPTSTTCTSRFDTH
jgi:hypothetical protein